MSYFDTPETYGMSPDWTKHMSTVVLIRKIISKLKEYLAVHKTVMTVKLAPKRYAEEGITITTEMKDTGQTGNSLNVPGEWSLLGAQLRVPFKSLYAILLRWWSEGFQESPMMPRGASK